MEEPIYVSGTVGINVLAAPGNAKNSDASKWSGKIVCMYDIHNSVKYCDPPPNVIHLHIDDFLQQLNTCSIIIEEPFMEEPTLTPIFSTDHVKKIKDLYNLKNIQIHGTDIRFNMLNASLHMVPQMKTKQTLLHYITPLLSMFRTNKVIDELYKISATDPTNRVFGSNCRVKLRKIKKKFLENTLALPPHYKSQLIYLYQTLQQRLYEFIIKVDGHLHDDLGDLFNKTTNAEREALNRDFPFSNIFINVYANSSIKKRDLFSTNWLYQLEILTDATMEMFTIATLLKEWKPCNVIYMGLVHMTRISHWLKTYFSFTQVLDVGLTDSQIPKYLDQITTSDSCVSLG